MFSPSSTRESSDYLYRLVSCQLLWPLLTSWRIENESIPSPPSVRRISLCLCLPHLLFRNSPWFLRALDFGSMWYLIPPHSLCMWFLFVSTDTAVWLTSVLTSQLTTLPLAWLPGTTPALTGFSPFGTLNFMSYIHHSRHTQCIKNNSRTRSTLKPKLLFFHGPLKYEIIDRYGDRQNKTRLVIQSL